MLLSCLLPGRNIEILRFFFNFLHNVARRSDENKMNSNNLAVIFAPNLLQSSDGHERMSASTEKKLQLQAAVVCTLIDHAAKIGFVPEFILEKIPALPGVEVHCGTPSLEGNKEGECESPGESRGHRRRSVGVLSSMVTPLSLTPSMKRRLPSDSSQGFSSKKLRSFKHNLAYSLLPNSLFDSGSTPASGQNEMSPCTSFEISQSSLSHSVISGKCLSNSGNQRRSKRLENKKVHRVESGKTGYFSPKISRKEMVRRSLRLKFSLGRNSRDSILNGHLTTTGSENIGWQQANKLESEKGTEPRKRETTFSPSQDDRFTKTDAKNSRSEENVLTPKNTSAGSHQMSWTGPSPIKLQEFNDQEGTPKKEYLGVTNHFSESALVAGRPPAIPVELKSATIASYKEEQQEIVNGDENATEKMLLKIQKAFSESGSNLHTLISETKSSIVVSIEEKVAETISEQQLESAKDLIITSMDIAEAKDDFNKQTLHKSCNAKGTNHENTNSLEKDEFQGYSESQHHIEDLQEGNTTEDLGTGLLVSKEEEQSHFINLLDGKVNMPDYPRQIKAVKLQPSTDHLSGKKNSRLNPLTLGRSVATAQPICTLPKSSKTENVSVFKICSVAGASVKCKPKVAQATNHVKVSDHIQWFNKLSLNDLSSGARPASSPKFPCTPVRQSVRRINSRCEDKRQVAGSTVVTFGGASVSLMKSVNCNGMISSCIEPVIPDSAPLLQYPKATAGRVSTSHEHLTIGSIYKKSCSQTNDTVEHSDSLENTRVNRSKAALLIQSTSVLEDVTNHEAQQARKGLVKKKSNLNSIPVATAENGVLWRISAKEKSRFKGSPKNPIAKARLLPASRPLEL
ncbi:rho GTPase-activating protein 11A isoform X2 [Rhinatrema bivittatum]|nr:rho GTPase-activating protein 11A isoform X2 [Rhinatrema bivittatum]